MSPSDRNLRQYLLGTVVTLLIMIGGCATKSLYARLDRVETELNKSFVSGAELKKDIEYLQKFTQQEFEAVRKMIADDLARHHK